MTGVTVEDVEPLMPHPLIIQMAQQRPTRLHQRKPISASWYVLRGWYVHCRTRSKEFERRLFQMLKRLDFAANTIMPTFFAWERVRKNRLPWACVQAFLAANAEGDRHQRRVNKITAMELNQKHTIETIDPAIAQLEQEKQRQQHNIELIASENFTSPAVMEVQGSVLTNKYAEGYPKRRWYGGCEYVDEAEQLAIDRAKLLFGAAHANVQPHSGSGANMAVYFSVLKPGDKILTMDLSHGGHLTHGNKANFSGKFFDVVHYGVRHEDELIDYDQLEALAQEHRPKMITVGASAYPRTIDFARMGAIAKSIGAYMLADIAHIAGLVAECTQARLAG